jgi:GxxExxY protein
MDTDDLDVLTRCIIGCAMTVSNKLGAGFLEKIYENALAIELRKAGLKVEQQKPLAVFYDGILVGEYFADVIVNGVVLLELKAAKAMDENHQAQLLNYLKATGFHIGLILNFGTPRLGIKRMVL